VEADAARARLKGGDDFDRLKAANKSFDFSVGQFIGLIFLNYLPFFHAASLAAVCFFVRGPWLRLLAGLAWLYLLPPLSARLLLLVSPPTEGRIKLGSADYFKWWALLSLQIIFCRLPFLEELLRLIPGAYSLWLRLWGSKIGRLTYWAPGARILDRSFLAIGNEVVFGAGVSLNPHVVSKNDEGELEVQLGTIRIGDRAVVGGYSILTAGTEIAAHECTRAVLLSPPFSKWRDGKRIKP